MTKKSPNLRTRLFQLHSWFGLHLFVILALMFLTGTLLVFVYQIEATFSSGQRLAEPAAIAERASFGQMYDAATAYAPDGGISVLAHSRSDWIADKAEVYIQGRGMRQLWFSGPEGSVGHESALVNLRRILFDFHSSFMTSHRIGALLAATFGFVVLGFAITGLVTYRRFWRGLGRLPSTQNGARGWWAGLHRLLGVWLAPFLLIAGFTGSIYFFTTANVMTHERLQARNGAPREAAKPAGFDGAAVDAAVAAATAAAPGATWEVVRLPGRANDPILLFGYDDAALTGAEAARAAVDPTNNEVLGVMRAAELSPVGRFLEATDQLHEGRFGGFATELLWVIFGAMATLLCAAGAAIYAARTWRPDSTQGPVGRILARSVFIKWGIPAFLLAEIALAVVRFT
ncbi:MAG: PepSY domain-containing protein [Roseivivax sp.]|nr:PepSY domain-containing protein [Roseivivax sp.]